MQQNNTKIIFFLNRGKSGACIKSPINGSFNKYKYQISMFQKMTYQFRIIEDGSYLVFSPIFKLPRS